VRGPVHLEVRAIRERIAVVAEIAQRDTRLEHHQESRALQLWVGHHIFKRKQGGGQNSCVRPRLADLGLQTSSPSRDAGNLNGAAETETDRSLRGPGKRLLSR
jgi:hypothetical protein